jgi:alcohol dehydrogenase
MKAAIFRGPGVVEIGVGWRGGPAPARIHIPELLDDVLAGTTNPGRVFDYETDLDHVERVHAAPSATRPRRATWPASTPRPSTSRSST